MFAFQPVVSAMTGEVDHYECLLRMRMPDGRDRLRRRLRAGHRAARLYPADRPLRAGQDAGRAGGASRGQARLQHLRPDRGRPAVAARADLAGAQPPRHRRRGWWSRSPRPRRSTTSRNPPVSSARCAMPAARSRSTISAPAIPRCGICRAWRSTPSRSTARSSAISRASPDNQVFLRHLLGLAKGFGFHTVAECVETAEEAAILRREGVGFLQGYYFGRPTLDRPWLDTPPAAAAPPPEAIELVAAPRQARRQRPTARLQEAGDSPACPA